MRASDLGCGIIAANSIKYAATAANEHLMAIFTRIKHVSVTKFAQLIAQNRIKHENVYEDY